MIQNIMHILKMKRIVLASSSPRRRDILKNIGLDIIVNASLFEENLDPKDFKSFEDFVIETALQKVLEVDDRMKKENSVADIIIGADTMVMLDGKLFGKPHSKQAAFDMLSLLSGKCHTIVTGVVVKTDTETVKFSEHSNVLLANLTDEQIWAYIETGEPLDKAGAYGIQGIGGTFIKNISGDYFNIVGLPLYKLSETLYEMFKDKIH